MLLHTWTTDPRGKESMCTTSPSMPQSCSHCLLMLTRAQADLLLAWQASRRHVVITTITFQMPWTPSSPSQRDQGGDEPIGREVCPELAQTPQTIPVARPVHERATLEPGYGPRIARAAHLSWYAVAAMCPGTRRPRSCPRTCGNPGVSTTAGPPASSTRVQEQEWRRSELLSSRTVACVIGTRPVKACGGFNLGVVEGSLNSTILLYYGMNTCLTIPLDDPNAWARPL